MKGVFGDLSPLERSLDYHQFRQELLTSNVANAETPGYRPLDVNFQASLDKAGTLAVTNEGHLPAGPGERMQSGVFADPSATAGNDGNAVSLEREMAKLSANSIRYRAAAEMISRHIGMLRYAATDGQRR
ncbi:MAG: flagellar basal body rod protein FlgB [Deltaproteobacteria bacterium]|nr:flagellar basal body rod protein FlgB [Deltaproteobacteria bacterium]